MIGLDRASSAATSTGIYRRPVSTTPTVNTVNVRYLRDGGGWS